MERPPLYCRNEEDMNVFENNIKDMLRNDFIAI